MPLVTTKLHEKCGGTGLIDGQLDPACKGTGQIELVDDAHDQAEFNIKYVVGIVDDLEDKVNDVMDKLNDIWQKLNE